MSTLVPPLFAGLVDDAVLLPPNDTDVGAAVAAHREHAAAWYAPLLGSLLVPSSLAHRAPPVGGLAVGVVCDTSIDGLDAAVAALRGAAAEVRQVEAAVARRGEDSQPGLRALHRFAATQPDLDVYAEIPLSWGLLAALDTVAGSRADGRRIGAKFRVGGLAAELFPTPVELAAVICACRDRELPFKLAVGQRHALRHTDPETGFTHHGFLNVLVGCAAAVDGAEVAEVAEVLAATHPVPLAEPARTRRDGQRPLLAGFGARNVRDPLTELVRVGLINGGYD
ncbi:hypothetical protein EV385_2358 [Krasilnikovia cinnamomea]|uniref:Uncharacterized protein n=1 Tax=Krasilnikovia cinnamomea TaxID=349313 RepID=A0A4Q7ZJT8_9ACTN|nr:hypothetical protein [Krasilnikovia cinnamomea]RZU50583.1 hypothetical protein EV385_2358 [Krasilnikovia cinnamomea]